MQVLKTKFHTGLLLFLLLCSWSMPAQTPPNREYQVKAAFLFNFAQFVEWPPAALPELSTPLVIGILGEDPFGSYLEAIISGEKINGHPLKVEHYRSLEEVKTCQILFLNITEPKKLGQVIASLKGRTILTVGDAPDFIQEGGMIRFFIGNNKIQFQINQEEAKSQRLIISSKLLRLAKTEGPGKK